MSCSGFIHLHSSSSFYIFFCFHFLLPLFHPYVSTSKTCARKYKEITRYFFIPLLNSQIHQTKVCIIWLHLWCASMTTWHFDWSSGCRLSDQNVKRPHYHAKDVTRWSQLSAFRISDFSMIAKTNLKMAQKMHRLLLQNKLLN